MRIPKGFLVAATGLSVALVSVAGVAVVAARRAGVTAEGNDFDPALYIGSVCALLLGVMAPVALLAEGRQRVQEDQDCDQDCVALREALESVENETIRGLAKINFTQMRKFVTIAQKQARLSYYASAVAAIVGLLVLVLGTASVVGLSRQSTEVTVGVLTGAGTVLSGYVTHTFVRSYAMASRQMSYYYGQPLVHCYLLHAEWLACEASRMFGSDAGQAQWERLITASLRSASDAQTHLLNLAEEAGWSSPHGPSADGRAKDVRDGSEPIVLH